MSSATPYPPAHTNQSLPGQSPGQGDGRPPRRAQAQTRPQIYTHTEPQTHKFRSVDELWFWFMHPVARASKHGSCLLRPCDADDVLRLVERLYRQRHLTLDHIRILRHYGLRARKPDPSRFQERHAHHLWCEALKRLDAACEQRGWIQSCFARAVIDLSLERVLKASV